MRLFWPLLLLFGSFSLNTLASDGAPNPNDTSNESANGSSKNSAQFKLEEKPRWEFGVGGAFVSGYDYPGSLDPNKRALALPYFIYRSPRLRVGGRGVNAIALENSRVKLDWSVAASLSSASEDNSARAGLPNLDYLFEVGPQIVVRLYDKDIENIGKLKSEWSGKIRAVFSTDFSDVASQGLVAATTVRFSLTNIKGSKVGLFSGLTSTFAGEDIQDYYYEVAPGFENESRPLYNASAGYLGTNFSLAVGMNLHPNVRAFAGVNVGLYSGAVNASSPLFETTSSTGFGVGIVWAIKRSKARIAVMENER